MKPFRQCLMAVVVLSVVLLVSCKPDRSRLDDGHIRAGKSGVHQDLFRIRYRPKWQAQAQFAGIYMAESRGIYEQYGLDVEIQGLLQAQDAIDSLKSGTSDVVHLDLLRAIDVQRDSTWITNIGQINQKNAILLVGKRSRGINSLNDFKGKKLGEWRSGSYLITDIFLKGSKIPMEIVPIDGSINLFTQNVVDVVNVMRYNEYHQLLQAGIKEEDLFVADLSELGYQIPDEGFYVSKEFYSLHPNECKAFVDATMDGWLYAFSHPEEAIDEVVKRMQQDNIRANRVHQRWMLDKMKEVIMPIAGDLGKLKKTDYQNAIKLMTEYYNFTRDIPFEEFCPNGAQK